VVAIDGRLQRSMATRTSSEANQDFIKAGQKHGHPLAID
jgi:hypothetical protein